MYCHSTLYTLHARELGIGGFTGNVRRVIFRSKSDREFRRVVRTGAKQVDIVILRGHGAEEGADETQVDRTEEDDVQQNPYAEADDEERRDITLAFYILILNFVKEQGDEGKDLCPQHRNGIRGPAEL